jgi:hypothetical protein
MSVMSKMNRSPVTPGGWPPPWAWPRPKTVRKGKPSGVWVTHQKLRRAEKQLAAQAQASYARTVRDWQASGTKNKEAGASVTAGRA